MRVAPIRVIRVEVISIGARLGLGLGLGLVLGLGLGLEEVFVFDSKRENRDRAVEAVRVRVRRFVVTGGHKGVLCVAEGGGKGVTSGLWLEGRLCSMLTVMLGGDLDVATWA